MRSIVFAIVGFWLIPSVAEADTPVKAAMATYLQIIEVEATIDACSRLDASNKISYEEVRRRYERQIRQIVLTVGILVGQEAKRSGIEKRLLFESIDALVETTVQRTEQYIAADPVGFTKICRRLPRAMLEGTPPFEPLDGISRRK